MAESECKARMVLTTAASREDAERLARVLVEERLIACATLLPGAQSVYRWQGAVETANETVMLMKTTVERVAGLEARLLALHSYETPEFLVVAAESGGQGYLGWLAASVGDE
jgi:periplasmic divalent cation tolerance protein